MAKYTVTRHVHSLQPGGQIFIIELPPDSFDTVPEVTRMIANVDNPYEYCVSEWDAAGEKIVKQTMGYAWMEEAKITP